MLAPLVSTIEVPCGQAQAYDIFVDMGSWWPIDKRSMSLMNEGAPAASLEVDPRVDGRIVETSPDGVIYHWGTFRTFDRPTRIEMGFHMGLPAEQASSVEVVFTPLGDDRTQVVLTQSNWEAFGDLAEMMRGGYGSGWVIIFEQADLSACTP